MPQHKVVEIEAAGWTALATSGEAAAEFYEQILDATVSFLLPGGLVLSERASVLKAMSGSPWESFELADMRMLSPTDDTAVVLYRAAARRGADSYSALIGSLYVHRRDGWKLTYHQQTPT